MATRLTDKINSYSLAVNQLFDENFTASTRPTNTGSSTISGTTNMTYYNGGISTVAKGPFPGQKCWNFNNSTLAAGIRYSNGAGNVLSSPIDDYIRGNADGSGNRGFTIGLWIKPKSFNSSLVAAHRVTNYTTYAPNNDPLWNGYYIGHGYDPVQGKNGFDFYSMGIDTFITSDHNGNDIVTNKWYYLALRRLVTFDTNTSNYSITHQIYINGTLKTTTQTIVTNNMQPAQYWWFGNASTAVPLNFDIACVHMAGQHILNATAIADIWKYGAPIQVPVKYYDGSAWQTSSDKKVYDGSEWIPMYANKWDGSAWQPI